MDEFCNRCGYAECRCDRENDLGYECPHCGYIPTHRELQNGTCPQCRDERRQAQQQANPQ